MDLTKEASDGGRILLARHINADKAVPGENNAYNSTLLCHTYSPQPDFGSYFAALGPYAWVLWTCGFIVLLSTCIVFTITLRAALRHWRDCTTNVFVVLAVYPIVAATAFLAIVMPRARILAEAIAQETVMIAMYQLFCMFLAECGGPDQLVRRAVGSRLETRVLPCCCWPCCIIPRPKIKQQSLEWLRYIVLQMPVVQGVLYIILLLLWAEDMNLYVNCFTYIQPFIIASILTGVWGIIICVKTVESAGHRPRPRFLVLQLVMLIVKIQCSAGKVLPEVFNVPCVMNLNPSVFVNMIQNSLMMVEMLLLSIWAWRLYRVPPGKDLDKAPNIVVAVLDESARSLEVKANKDGIENKSFNERFG